MERAKSQGGPYRTNRVQKTAQPTIRSRPFNQQAEVVRKNQKLRISFNHEAHFPKDQVLTLEGKNTKVASPGGAVGDKGKVPDLDLQTLEQAGPYLQDGLKQ
jgi:hypothetical protein